MINKAYVFYRANSIQLEKNTGYKHLEKINPSDAFSIAGNIFNLGLNVMVYHSDDNSIILFIDFKRFQQR